jgi:hypothetical protein
MDFRVDGEACGVDGMLALDNLSVFVDANEVGYFDVGEMDGISVQDSLR